jgi:glycosyltransferase involved in cell wall biosynthesis
MNSFLTKRDPLMDEINIPPAIEDQQRKRSLVSVIAPVYNEDAVIQEFHKRLQNVISDLEQKWDFEIILVNDGSRDRSLKIMQDLVTTDSHLRIIDLRRNYGQTAALQCGIDEALGDIIITMDSDLQHFPEEIPIFLKKLCEGYDIVCGWRADRAEGIIRRWPSKVANKFIHWITGLQLHDFGTTFRAYRADIAKEIRIYGEFHRFVPVMGHILGARICELPIKNIERPKGTSNYGVGRTFGVFLDLLLVYFFVHHMDRPMRFFGKVGMFMAGVGLSIISVLFVYSIIYDLAMIKERLGWFMIAIVHLVGALQAFFSGILAEILIRIRYEQDDSRVYKIRGKYTKLNQTSLNVQKHSDTKILNRQQE